MGSFNILAKAIFWSLKIYLTILEDLFSKHKLQLNPNDLVVCLYEI